MKKTRFYSMLVAIAMTLSVSIFNACGDSNSDPTPTPTPTPTPAATSCTLYLIEGYAASNFDLADMSVSFVKDGVAASFVTINKDDLTDIDHIAPAEVQAKIKNGTGIPSQIKENGYFRVTPIAVTSFPSVYSVKYNFTAKASYPEDVVRSFGFYQSFITIDNQGRCSSASGTGQYTKGIMLNKISEFLNMVAKDYQKQITVSTTSGIVSVAVTK